MMTYKTLVIGASPNPERKSHQAVARLKAAGHPVVALGVREGVIAGVSIKLERPADNDFHTISLYLNPKIQAEYYEYILSLNPKRLIFNPGAENNDLYKLAADQGIEAMNACTLVMLSIGNY